MQFYVIITSVTADKFHSGGRLSEAFRLDFFLQETKSKDMNAKATVFFNASFKINLPVI